MDPMTIARYGMLAAERRFQASAGRVAQSAADPGVDLSQEAVEQAQAKLQFTASANVVKFADAMWRSLISIQSARGR